jgi:hypothetical protein
MCKKYLSDELFLKRFKQRLNQSKQQMLESKLEGASLFRELCKIVCSFYSLDFDDDDDDEAKNVNDSNRTIQASREMKREHVKIQALESFTVNVDIPNMFTELLKEFINAKSSLKEVSSSV